MKGKSNIWLPIVLMGVFALTRWPGMLPQNFSAAYALTFCAGVYFPKRLVWWLPLATLLVTDVFINLYYLTVHQIDSFKLTQLANYLAFSVIIWLGARFGPKLAWYKLLCGGILGAALFYLITNTSSWFFNPFHNPEYSKTWGGWIRALTTGTAGWPQTWEFFRNTLLSGGLFTGLFVGAMKFSERLESKERESESEDKVPDIAPEESQA